MRVTTWVTLEGPQYFLQFSDGEVFKSSVFLNVPFEMRADLREAIAEAIRERAEKDLPYDKIYVHALMNESIDR